MRLIIAEKPSLGRGIADVLGHAQAKQGCLVCGQDTVTWCFGHILEQFAPEDYDLSLKLWRKDTLPIIPEQWKLKPSLSSIAQLRIIGDLLKSADSVVHAGDPDREGQLLVDEVLEHFGYTGSVTRIWLASLDARSVSKALATLSDNRKHAPLRDSARARSQADWLVGLNATRALTIMGREAGREGVLSLGRVQTPTLNLVVMRDREIAAFKPKDFFTVHAVFDHDAGKFQAAFVPREDQAGLDAEGRLVDQAVAMGLVSSLQHAPGAVSGVTREKKKTAPPLPHCLSSLQKAASSKFGLGAQQTLDAAQSLYEKKLTTYPRSDCRYLPVEQFDDAGRILASLASNVPSLEQAASNANPKLKSGTWDTAKVTAHHAIVPTGEAPGALSGPERDIYNMIALAYCLQFYPHQVYESQKIKVAAADKNFEAKGRVVLEAGWTSVGNSEEDEISGANNVAEQSLPLVSQRDALICAEASAQRKKTTPPPKFTEGALIEAMANIHRFVQDAAAKAVLRENEGIGTEATRAGIIEGLKKRGYLIAKGKAIVSTPLAGQVIDLTPDTLKDPITTAQWESKLELIAKGELTLSEFMAEQARILPELLAPLLSDDAKMASSGHVHKCPACGKPMRRRKKDGKTPFWGCTAYPECSKTLPDHNGKPDFTGKTKAPGTVTEHKCQQCGMPLIKRKGVSRKTGRAYDYYTCSGYPACAQRYFDKNGSPDFS